VRVLLVDDNPAMIARVATVLAPGCTVVGSATNGATAIQSALALHPDVIVLDVSMPGMTGLEVASRLRMEGSTAAVVFLTIHDEDDIIAAAQESGGIGYVVKPRLASDLMFAVREASAGRSFVSPVR
jgi:DNA-binding NarL/FixJ family response regulator